VYTPDINGLNKELGCEVAQVIIVHALPAEVHLDPYELESLSRSSSGMTFFAHGLVELELPGPLCQPNTLTVHMAAPDGATMAGLVTTAAPVHSRYPSLTGCQEAGPTNSKTFWLLLSSGTVDVNIGLPTLLASCSAGVDSKQDTVEILHQRRQGPAKSSSHQLSGHSEKEESNGLHWRIPSGNTCHSNFVGILTSSVASLLCLHLLAELAFVHFKH